MRSSGEFRSGEGPRGWARVGAVAAARPAHDDGYCRIFSLDWWMICLALFATFFAFGGDLSVVVYIGACALVALRNPGLAWRALARCWPVLLVPAWALLSTLWSDQPSVTLKQSLELMLTFVLAAVACRRAGGRELAAAGLFAGFLFCLLSLAYQRNALDQPLIGLMGSKNQMAFASEVLLLGALATAFAPGARSLRLFALLGCALGLLVVILARSAGIWVTSAAAVAAFFAFNLLSRASFATRAVIVALALLAAAPLAFAFQDVEDAAQTFQREVLHKDATLTGRTELWTAAQTIIAESPVLGHGYDAFWQPGNLEAEALSQTSRTARFLGFNFHNQFLDAWVDTGAVGVGLLAIVLAYVGGGALWRAMRAPDAASAFIASLMLALYLRLPVESTLIGPWNAATFLWVAIGVSAYASSAWRAEPARQAAPSLTDTWRASHERLRTARRPARLTAAQ